MMTNPKLSDAQISLHRVIASGPITFFNSRLMRHIDTAVYKLTRGRTTFLAFVARLPVITLTTTGAKSGLPRTLPLIGIRDPAHPEIVGLIASNWGQEHSPAWYYNLKANSRASGTINGKATDYVAHEATGEEYDYFWRLAVNTYAGYSVYKVRASNRHIPVMVLTPTQS